MSKQTLIQKERTKQVGVYYYISRMHNGRLTLSMKCEHLVKYTRHVWQRPTHMKHTGAMTRILPHTQITRTCAQITRAHVHIHLITTLSINQAPNHAALSHTLRGHRTYITSGLKLMVKINQCTLIDFHH